MKFILSSGNNEQSINEITLRMTMKEHYWAIMILSAFIAVSYTHLDVYKRQGLMMQER